MAREARSTKEIKKERDSQLSAARKAYAKRQSSSSSSSSGSSSRSSKSSSRSGGVTRSREGGGTITVTPSGKVTERDAQGNLVSRYQTEKTEASKFIKEEGSRIRSASKSRANAQQKALEREQYRSGYGSVRNQDLQYTDFSKPAGERNRQVTNQKLYNQYMYEQGAQTVPVSSLSRYEQEAIKTKQLRQSDAQLSPFKKRLAQKLRGKPETIKIEKNYPTVGMIKPVDKEENLKTFLSSFGTGFKGGFTLDKASTQRAQYGSAYKTKKGKLQDSLFSLGWGLGISTSLGTAGGKGTLPSTFKGAKSAMIAEGIGTYSFSFAMSNEKSLKKRIIKSAAYTALPFAFKQGGGLIKAGASKAVVASSKYVPLAVSKSARIGGKAVSYAAGLGLTGTYAYSSYKKIEKSDDKARTALGIIAEANVLRYGSKLNTLAPSKLKFGERASELMRPEFQVATGAGGTPPTKRMMFIARNVKSGIKKTWRKDAAFQREYPFQQIAGSKAKGIKLRSTLSKQDPIYQGSGVQYRYSKNLKAWKEPGTNSPRKIKDADAFVRNPKSVVNNKLIDSHEYYERGAFPFARSTIKQGNERYIRFGEQSARKGIGMWTSRSDSVTGKPSLYRFNKDYNDFIETMNTAGNKKISFNLKNVQKLTPSNEYYSKPTQTLAKRGLVKKPEDIDFSKIFSPAQSTSTRSMVFSSSAASTSLTSGSILNASRLPVNETKFNMTEPQTSIQPQKSMQTTPIQSKPTSIQKQKVSKPQTPAESFRQRSSLSTSKSFINPSFASSVAASSSFKPSSSYRSKSPSSSPSPSFSPSFKGSPSMSSSPSLSPSPSPSFPKSYSPSPSISPSLSPSFSFSPTPSFGFKGPNFSLGSTRKSFLKAPTRSGTQKGYRPTLYSSSFNIKGKQTKKRKKAGAITGLGIRPL